MKNKLYLIAIVSLLTISSIACGKEETAPAIEGTPVAEEPAVEEEETVEKTTTPTTEEEPAEITEPTVSDNEAEETTDEHEDEPYTEADLATYEEKDLAYLKRVYKFMCRMDSSIKETEDMLEILNSGVLDPVTPEQLLNLLNEDFAKAYDIIEECGITVTNDEGKELIPTEMRTTITDFDSFHDAYMDIIVYTGGIARVRSDYAKKTKDYIAAKDAENGAIYLDKWEAIDLPIYALEEFIDFYQMAYTRSEE